MLFCSRPKVNRQRFALLSATKSKLGPHKAAASPASTKKMRERFYFPTRQAREDCGGFRAVLVERTESAVLPMINHDVLGDLRDVLCMPRHKDVIDVVVNLGWRPDQAIFVKTRSW